MWNTLRLLQQGGSPVPTLTSSSEFTLVHTLGQRQVSLQKIVNRYLLTVNCTVPIRVRNIDKSMRVRRSKYLDTSTSSPKLFFSCLVESTTNELPFCIEALCHATQGLLVIDSVGFHLRHPEYREGPEQYATQLSYGGPNVTQGNLADLVVNSPSGLESLLFPNASTFDATRNAAASPILRYGHLPVHTINPKLSQKIAETLELLAIDDSLAQYVETVAKRIEVDEEEAWNKVFLRSLT